MISELKREKWDKEVRRWRGAGRWRKAESAAKKKVRAIERWTRVIF